MIASVPQRCQGYMGPRARLSLAGALRAALRRRVWGVQRQEGGHVIPHVQVAAPKDAAHVITGA